jgi:hypothetical protein
MLFHQFVQALGAATKYRAHQDSHLIFELRISGENSYQLFADNSEILKGKVGELARSSDGISLLVTDLIAKN